MARLIAVLRVIDPKTPLPIKLEPQLTARMQEEPFKKKPLELIIPGEKPDKAYFLLAGYILVYYIDQQGEIRVVRIACAEEIIATDAFMQHGPSPLYIVAMRQAVYISISYDNMQAIYRGVEGVQELAVKTAANYQKLEMQRDILVNKPMREKILEFYSSKKDLLPAKRSPLKDAYIASYLRINIHTFRRVRNEMIAEGLLK